MEYVAGISGMLFLNPADELRQSPAHMGGNPARGFGRYLR